MKISCQVTMTGVKTIKTKVKYRLWNKPNATS